MVDCRPGAAAPHELSHAANGAENHNQSAPGDMGAHALPSPPGARTTTPAAPMPSYSVVPSGGVPVNSGGGGGGGSYYGGCVKSLVWCASPPPHPPPPVNPHVVKSVQPNGADLPMNDIPTLRYYFNLGVECMWAAYGAPPPRHYSPRDLAQDMQQISLQDRSPGGPPHEHKHKDNNKPPMQGKGNGQRPLLGPRFKRNQDGAPNNHQNKPHNNNVPNKGPNNRRNSVPEPRYEEGAEPALVPLPYMPYPPPIYPLPYYPVEDPAMLGMMGGMGYVSYEETLPYYPQPYPPPPPLHNNHLHPAHPPHPAHAAHPAHQPHHEHHK